MSAVYARDLTLVIDAETAPGGEQYSSALFDGWPEDGKLIQNARLSPFSPCTQEKEEERGAALFDWLLAPGSEIRAAFLERCAGVAGTEALLRLWVSVDPARVRDPFFHFQDASPQLTTWEGMWVREWADPATCPPRVRSPFLALNPWVSVLRRPPRLAETQPEPHLGRLDVLLVVSNPPLGCKEHRHLEYLARSGGGGMVPVVERLLNEHPHIGLVHRLDNPDCTVFAAAVREHRPAVVIYLGHGYRVGHRAGLVLRGEGDSFGEVAGTRSDPEVQCALELVFSGRSTPEEPLPVSERPRLVLLLCCEAAPAAPALLGCGIQAVLAMRCSIPDGASTEVMIERILDAAIRPEQPLETALADLRLFLKESEKRLSPRLDFSAPVLHLAARDGRLFPTEEQYARGEFLRCVHEDCGQYLRRFRDSPLNELTERSYRWQDLEGRRRERVETPKGFREEWVPYTEEAQDVLDRHHRIVVVGPAGRGKTSLLRRLALSAADRLAGDETTPAPLYLPLPDLQERGGLEGWLRQRFRDVRVRRWLRTRMDHGNVHFFLDGLDEMANRQEVLKERGALADLLGRASAEQARVVAACRDSAYDASDDPKSRARLNELGFTRLALQPLSADAVRGYAREFFGDKEAAGPFLEAIRETGEGGRERILDLAHEPLYLHMLCWLYAGLDPEPPGESRLQLPAAKDDLWERVVERLLEQRDVRVSEARDHLRLLEELAFHHRFCGQQLTREFAEETAAWRAELLKLQNPRKQARAWLADLIHWELLAAGERGSYRFAISSLDEHFAARHLAGRGDPEDPDHRDYRRWLPCRRGWWHFGTGLRCPNPACRQRAGGKRLPPFRRLLLTPERRDTMLLMAGLLDDPEREDVLLTGIPCRLPVALAIGLRAQVFAILGLIFTAWRPLGWSLSGSATASLFLWLGWKALAVQFLFPSLRRRMDVSVELLGRLRTKHPKGASDVAAALGDGAELGAFGRAREDNEPLSTLERARNQGNREGLSRHFVRWYLRRSRERSRALEFLGAGGAYDADPVKAIENVEDLQSQLTLLLLCTAFNLFWWSDWSYAHWAQRAIGAIAGSEAVSKLVEALRDADSGVRDGAAQALGYLQNAAAVPALIEALRDKHTSVRISAVGALGRLGEAAGVPALAETLRHGDRHLRWRAADALAAIGETTAVPALVEALHDDCPNVRCSAAMALGMVGEAAEVPALTEALRDEDSDVRRIAAAALSRLAEAAAVPALVDVLRDGDQLVRRSAAEALGKVGKAAVPALVDALRDKDERIRCHAARALGPIGASAAVPALLEALQDEDGRVRGSAAEALGKIGEAAAVPALLEVLRDEDRAVRRSAAVALGEIGTAAAVPGLLEALRDEDWWVRGSAAEALGQTGAAAAVPGLLEALRDEYWWVRRKAAQALGKIGERLHEPQLAGPARQIWTWGPLWWLAVRRVEAA